MRRLLALLVAALPAAAAAQSAGQMYFDAKADFVINQAACAGTGTVGLTWLAKEETAGDFAAYTGKYDLYAGPTDKTDAFPYCVLDDARRLTVTDPEMIDPFSLGVTAPVEVSISALVTAAGYSCTSEDKTLYVCVVWTNEAGAVKAYAKGDVALKVAPPEVPTVVSVSPGEEALYVRVAETAGTVETDEVQVRVEAGGEVHDSDWAVYLDSPVEVRVGGLRNGVGYTVTARARSAEENVSAWSDCYGATATDPTCVTVAPVPVMDGWEAYQLAGGRDAGGCGPGGAGLLALLGAGALLRIRRRP